MIANSDRNMLVINNVTEHKFIHVHLLVLVRKFKYSFYAEHVRFTKRGEVTGEWRKLHSGELNDLNCSPNFILRIKSRRMRWAGHVTRRGERGVVYRVLVRKPEGKKPLGRPRCRWEDNIKVGPQEVGCGGMDWIDQAQDRDRWRAMVNAVMNLRVP